jgi:hypothetical protein
VSDPPAAPIAPTLRWAVILLGLEAAALAVVVGVLIYEDVTTTPTSVRGAVLVTLYAVIMTVVLAGLAWALHRRQKWARGPAIVMQLLLVPIGFTMASGGAAWLGVPTILVGLAGAGTLLAPATRAALGMN